MTLLRPFSLGLICLGPSSLNIDTSMLSRRLTLTHVYVCLLLSTYHDPLQVSIFHWTRLTSCIRLTMMNVFTWGCDIIKQCLLTITRSVLFAHDKRISSYSRQMHTQGATQRQRNHNTVTLTVTELPRTLYKLFRNIESH